jgi:putative membrane protein
VDFATDPLIWVSAAPELCAKFRRACPPEEDAMMYWGCWDGAAQMPWFGMILGPLAMIVALVIAGLAIAYGLRAFGLGWGSPTPARSALEILKERFARGEIDRNQYEDGKRLLSTP